MITSRSALTASSAIAASSASEATIPVGLCGELTINALVRGVTARAQRVDVDREAASVGHHRDRTRWQPAIAMTGE